MKLAINLVISLIKTALGSIELRAFWPYLAGYVGLLAATHFFRAWRWNNLLRPMGVDLPAGKLLAISSVGFMAILALPVRLGEAVRPALLRKKGKVSASAVFGTVAVERIVDGLVVSLLVFACCFALRGTPGEKHWMMPMAWISLAVFLAAMIFLGFALKWPRVTVKICVQMTLLPLISRRWAAKLEAKVYDLIKGFLVLKDWQNLAWFCVWSVIYWAANGFGMWVLARGCHLDLSVVGAFATMGIIAVGISLPNTPGLVGQFHYLTTLGLSLYLSDQVAQSAGLVYAILLHGIQVVWYVGVGALAMFTSHVSFADAMRRDDDEAEAAPETAA